MDVKEKRQAVVEWCASVGLDAKDIAADDAVLYRQDDGSVCFKFRKYDLNAEGHRELCHDCGHGCSDHYCATRHELCNLPAPEFWTSDNPTLNLGSFASGY